ncbi:MAG: HlyD family type I secretion periplasmic adaptor subunit [Pseudomonadota bacterium]|nr:HlyD family type I secretion periplasmic adaptor subunit [Pseudomonadota bacterium]
MTQGENQNNPNNAKKSGHGQNERSFAAGEFVFEEGDVGEFAYVLLSGEAEICKISQGEIIKLVDIKENTLFGEMALIDKSVRSASARAVTDIIVREIDETAFMAHIKKSPDVAMNMMYRLANYARTTNKNIEGSVFDKKEEEIKDDNSLDIEETLDSNKILQRHENGRLDIPNTLRSIWRRFSNIFESSELSDAEHIIDEYQSASVATEKSSLPPIVRNTVLTIIFLLGSFVAWASFSVIDTTLSARGRLSTTVPTIEVQATDNSVVESIEVSIGQRVKKGDVIVTLDETYAEADLKRSEMEFRLLEAKIRRLEAEMDTVKGFDPKTIRDQLQEKVFINRQKEYTSKIASFNLDMKSLELKLTSTSMDIGLAKEQLKIQKDIENARRDLFKRNVGSRLNMLQAKNTRLSVQREYSKLNSSVRNLKSELESLRADKQNFVSGWFSKIGIELSQSSNERDSMKEDLVKLRRRKENVKILAPADGVIMDMQNLFVGALVREGDTIMSLVPSDVPLTVELDIDPKNIGNLMLGAKVSVKLDALPYQKHGEILGEISFISKDTVDTGLDGSKGTFYRARSTMASNELRDLPGNFSLVPGMLLNGDIRAGKRRLITYFLYPVMRTIKTSFTEPGQ